MTVGDFPLKRIFKPRRGALKKSLASGVHRRFWEANRIAFERASGAELEGQRVLFQVPHLFFFGKS
ncbi:MAG: hypothetical protein C5B49_09070 [Bdellovibrio sp.]|nr:MAG: hypothetical protein C5B49_09070 [Bdellovibrio sp.]